MIIRPLERRHLVGVTVHPKQAHHQHLVDAGEFAGSAWSGFIGRDLVAFGGVVPADDGLAMWLLFTDRMRARHMIAVSRAIRGVVAGYDGTLYADIDPARPEAVRLARLLGMEYGRPILLESREMNRMVAGARIS